MFAQGKITTDRSVIQKWAKARRGWPAIIRQATSTGIDTVLSIVFPENSESEGVHQISWEEFFEKFEKQGLVFIYQEQDNTNQLSRYYAFV